MSAAPVAHYLAEFGRGVAGVPIPIRRETVASVLLRSPADEMAERLAEATARGRDEGRVAAEAEHALALAEERRRSAAELAAERSRWSSAEGERLGDLIGEGLARIEQSLAASAAAILKPFIEQRRREDVVAKLAETLSMLLGRSDAALVRVEGAADLIAALRDRMGERAALCEYRESERPDITVLCDETLIETRLGDWAARLAEAPHG